MKKIVVIDPGEVCGVVEVKSVSHLHDLDDPPAILDMPDLSIVRYESAWNNWEMWLRLVQTSDIIICEDFRLFQGKARHMSGNQLKTVRLIGALDAFCYLENTLFVLQQPSLMSAYPDKRLKGLGLWHKSEHVRSAIKHLLWAIYQGKNPTEGFCERIKTSAKTGI